jgi:methylenetetrahydrofolate dehydrogenase (NADP+) / methenyltetrahydrofolate cyclohydrolase
LIISATGVKGIIKAEDLKQGVGVIDVGLTECDGLIAGDVEINEEMLNKVEFITTVPGGIGPITISCIFNNLAKIYTGKFSL